MPAKAVQPHLDAECDRQPHFKKYYRVFADFFQFSDPINSLSRWEISGRKKRAAFSKCFIGRIRFSDLSINIQS